LQAVWCELYVAPDAKPYRMPKTRAIQLFASLVALFAADAI
jgi:hypothetical protein